MRTSAFGAPPVALLLGDPQTPRAWLSQELRGLPHPVMATALPEGLSTAATASVCSAVDAGVHLVSATRGFDDRFLEAWQLLAEAGTARFVAVTDLGPGAIDVQDAAAMATRVLDEEVIPAGLPLLDDDEQPVAMLDLAGGKQWRDGSRPEPAEESLWEAVALESAVLSEAALIWGTTVDEAIAGGGVPVAFPLVPATRTGLEWLAAHLPPRRSPATGTVLPGDHPDRSWLAAGSVPIRVGAVEVLYGSDVRPNRILSLAALGAHRLLDRVPPGEVAAATWEIPPPVGGFVLPQA